ncbi:MAG: MBL fold metallo-hydrolase [Phycisphaerales bacterium]|nr:MBL fold metallo-hydrolase [Phycisphaerales bacterium]
MKAGASSSVAIDGFALGDYQTNCYIVREMPARGVDGAAAAAHRPCWIIDTPPQPRRAIQFVRDSGLTPVAIIYTHAHLDHIEGQEEFLAAFGDIPRLGHPSERDWFADPILNLSALSGIPVSVRPPTADLLPGQLPAFAGTDWQAWHTPGHSPGSVSLVSHGARMVINGDTLFAGSIGRVDLPGANPEHMKHSLFELLLSLPDDYAVYPGHGPATSIGKERSSNPFLGLDGRDW